VILDGKLFFIGTADSFRRLCRISYVSVNAAGGWSKTDCAGIIFHLFKVSGLGVDEQLILRLYPNTGTMPGVAGIQEGRWWDVQAERCTRDGKCEKVDSARLWLDRWSKRVSAKYEIEFGGKHLTGTFDVKNRRPKAACQ
jgi:hypothetical protein